MNTVNGSIPLSSHYLGREGESLRSGQVLAFESLLRSFDVASPSSLLLTTSPPDSPRYPTNPVREGSQAALRPPAERRDEARRLEDDGDHTLRRSPDDQGADATHGEAHVDEGPNRPSSERDEVLVDKEPNANQDPQQAETPDEQGPTDASKVGEDDSPTELDSRVGDKTNVPANLKDSSESKRSVNEETPSGNQAATKSTAATPSGGELAGTVQTPRGVRGSTDASIFGAGGKVAESTLQLPTELALAGQVVGADADGPSAPSQLQQSPGFDDQAAPSAESKTPKASNPKTGLSETSISTQIDHVAASELTLTAGRKNPVMGKGTSANSADGKQDDRKSHAGSKRSFADQAESDKAELQDLIESKSPSVAESQRQRQGRSDGANEQAPARAAEPAFRVDSTNDTTQPTQHSTARQVTSKTSSVEQSSGSGRTSLTTYDANRFINRVWRAVELAHQRGEMLQIRLSPPELGSLRIEIAMRNGALTAYLETDTGTTRNMLLDHLPELRERLAEQNIRVDRFEVDVREEFGGRHHDRGSSYQENRQRNGAAPASTTRQHPEEAGQEGVHEPLPIRLNGGGQLNLVV